MQRARFGTLLASILSLLAAPASASSQTLDHVRASGTLRLGYVAEARPFSYLDASGKPDGYAVSVCQSVADAMKADLKLPDLKVEFVRVGAEDRFDALNQDRIDLLCTGGAPTVLRRGQVSFSIPVFLGGVGALMRKDAPAKLHEVLEGRPEPYQPRWRASLGQVLRDRTFAVPRGTTAEGWLKEKIGDLDIDAKMEVVDDFASGATQVASGRADVLFGERAILLDTAKQNPSAEDLFVLERHFTYEAAALALARSDEDFRLLVDRALSKLFRSDEIERIYTPFFGKPDARELGFLRMNALPE